MTERLRSTIEDPYAAVREGRNPANAVPQKLTNHFKNLVKRAVIRTAFPGQRPGRVMHRFLDTAQRETPFRFVIEEENDAIGNADIILMDHQGPKMDDIGGVDGDNPETVRGTGGSEGLYAHALLPPHTRYVLKNYLVSLPVWDAVCALARFDLQAAKKELSQIFMALAFRKTRPIVVDRTTEKPPRQEGMPDEGNSPEERQMLRGKRRAPYREYVRRMRMERRRVAEAICRALNEGEPVMVFPEGTRSNDGKIQGFVSEYFQSIVTDYIPPRLEDSRSIRIGIIVADILSAFPDGVGTDVRAYDAPITLRGIAYDPAIILAALRERMDRCGATPLSEGETKRFGRTMLMDARRQMAEGLVSILERGDARSHTKRADDDASPAPLKTLNHDGNLKP